MARLSVNINKIATLRNARGGNNPNVLQVALDCVQFGAEGITVHPRPDERHITRKDVYDISNRIDVEFNIEGYPDARFLEIVGDVRPAQATLVPDPPGVLTSNAGWDTVSNSELLKDIVGQIKALGVRVSIFVDPSIKMVEGAAAVGADRIELYTEPYAAHYHLDKQKAVKPYIEAANLAHQLGLGVNAGHDLDLYNLRYLTQQIPHLDEVSIGHALICDALYYGLENTIQMYLKQLED